MVVLRSTKRDYLKRTAVVFYLVRFRGNLHLRSSCPNLQDDPDLRRSFLFFNVYFPFSLRESPAILPQIIYLHRRQSFIYLTLDENIIDFTAINLNFFGISYIFDFRVNQIFYQFLSITEYWYFIVQQNLYVPICRNYY